MCVCVAFVVRFAMRLKDNTEWEARGMGWMETWNFFSLFSAFISRMCEFRQSFCGHYVLPKSGCTKHQIKTKTCVAITYTHAVYVNQKQEKANKKGKNGI